MQRQEFVQRLWLDHVHEHPDIAALRLWPIEAPAEYLALLTLSHPRWAMPPLVNALTAMGYTRKHRYAMADRGLLATLLAPPAHEPWLVLAELQLDTLSRAPRRALKSQVDAACAPKTMEILLPGDIRRWPMPSWHDYQALSASHPLAAWLSLRGPRLHHVGFDCERLGKPLNELDALLYREGMNGEDDRHQGFLPVSSLLDYRYYRARPRRLAFAQGDEHRVHLGGLALVQKQLATGQERAAEILMPHHTRCELG
ncbi:MAG TPA: DUF1338 domain-containing protein [Halomonas sp.]|nr:DUF1338 domain-containing protein [Halomonas sp.]